MRMETTVFPRSAVALTYAMQVAADIRCLSRRVRSMNTMEGGERHV